MTLSFQTRLILFSTVTFAALLAGLSATSYHLLKRQLDLDATADLAEQATGLHGYLRFDGEAPTIALDNEDADQVAFVHRATRYYQIYDAGDGRLLVQSEGLEPLGLHFTPDEVGAFGDGSFDASGKEPRRTHARGSAVTWMLLVSGSSRLQKKLIESARDL
jgi:hypothetical protein